jgi:hypothetical protein
MRQLMYIYKIEEFDDGHTRVTTENCRTGKMDATGLMTYQDAIRFVALLKNCEGLVSFDRMEETQDIMIDEKVG